MTITRSTGTPVIAGGVIYGMAGGGYQGLTDALDAVVREAAEALTRRYAADVEIRFNSDRESGGAWLKTADGRNNRVGIGASLVTARQRASWQRWAEECESEAETGLSHYNGRKLTDEEREGARELATVYREALEMPEGQLTVFAHITDDAAGPRRGELAQLDGWSGHLNGRGYHHGPAATVAGALVRCRYFAPPGAELPPWQVANNGTGKRIWFLVRGAGADSDRIPVQDRYHCNAAGTLVRYASADSAQRAADRLNNPCS